MGTGIQGQATAMRRAERILARHDMHLSAPQRHILHLLLAAARPLSAYALRPLVEGLLRRSVKPVTVYRAIKALVRVHLIARVESQRAYVVVANPESDKDLVFLLCETCQGCAQVEDQEVRPFLAADAEKAGFRPFRSVIEVHGHCANCLARVFSVDGDPTAAPVAARAPGPAAAGGVRRARA